MWRSGLSSVTLTGQRMGRAHASCWHPGLNQNRTVGATRQVGDPRQPPVVFAAPLDDEAGHPVGRDGARLHPAEPGTRAANRPAADGARLCRSAERTARAHAASHDAVWHLSNRCSRLERFSQPPAGYMPRVALRVAGIRAVNRRSLVTVGNCHGDGDRCAAPSCLIRIDARQDRRCGHGLPSDRWPLGGYDGGARWRQGSWRRHDGPTSSRRSSRQRARSSRALETSPHLPSTAPCVYDGRQPEATPVQPRSCSPRTLGSQQPGSSRRRYLGEMLGCRLVTRETGHAAETATISRVPSVRVRRGDARLSWAER